MGPQRLVPEFPSPRPGAQAVQALGAQDVTVENARPLPHIRSIGPVRINAQPLRSQRSAFADR
jgi:hypothetical protein